MVMLFSASQSVCTYKYYISFSEHVHCLSIWSVPSPTVFPMRRVQVFENLPTFSVIQTEEEVNLLECARVCMNQSRDTCGMQGECTLVSYNTTNRICYMHFVDVNAGSNVTCTNTNLCYMNSLFTS